MRPPFVADVVALRRHHGHREHLAVHAPLPGMRVTESWVPDDAPADPSANLKAMRVSDLLRMSTGQQTEPPRKADQPWLKTFLAHPVPFKPGLARFAWCSSRRPPAVLPRPRR